jgi:hypothetical protein
MKLLIMRIQTTDRKSLLICAGILSIQTRIKRRLHIMIKAIIFGAMMFTLFVFTGCWAPKSILTTANITQPVLVGKVKTIGGKPIENYDLKKEIPFNEPIENSRYFYTAIYYEGHGFTEQGSNLLDEKLLPLSDETSAMIIVDSIRFKVFSGYWFFAFRSANHGWLQGAKYYYK